MHLRIDYAIQPSGLIASAKTYTLVVRDGHLYGIHIGPAGNPVRTTDPISRWAVNWVYKRIAVKVEEGMARFANSDMETMAREKHSFKSPLSGVTEAEVHGYGDGVQLRFRVDNKKYRFNIRGEYGDRVTQLLGAVSQKA